jgi:hypothetical protein
MDKFLDTHDLPKMSQEDKNHINKSTTSNKIEAVIKSPNTKKPELNGFWLLNSI